MRFNARARLLWPALACAIVSACGSSPTAPGDDGAVTSGDARTAGLTERLETEHFVFHFRPGDVVAAEPSEAYHRWAVSYLDVTPPKKIDYYKYRSAEDLATNLGQNVGGTANPHTFSIYTFYPWHNHECFHLYSLLIGDPIMFFTEGMAVAHEFDPSSNDWVARRNRGTISEPYLDMVRRWRAAGELYPLESLIDSENFADLSRGDGGKAYREAGMFVSFLIARHGLEPMKEVFRSVRWRDSADVVQAKFLAIYGQSFSQAEAAWLAWLDELNGGVTAEFSVTSRTLLTLFEPAHAWPCRVLEVGLNARPRCPDYFRS